MKRSPSAIQGAVRIVAEFCREHPNEIAQFLDDGLEVRAAGSKGITVLCRSCGTLLVITEARRKADLADREEAARDLALVNVLRNPCCDRWR